MKVTLESTTKIVTLEIDGKAIPAPDMGRHAANSIAVTING